VGAALRLSFAFIVATFYYALSLTRVVCYR
jgi:hypothetical protein